MFLLFFAMVVILVAAGAVFVYVAYPHRGQEVPHAPWLGDALKRGVEAFPVLEDEHTPRH